MVSFLLIFTFFALALLMSTVSKDSGNALLYSLIVMIVLTSFIPIFAYTPVYSAVFGDPPDLPGRSTYSYLQGSSAYMVTSVAVKEQSYVAILGLLVMAGVAAGLWYMFRKYGRR
jgi:ABC-2 type transport system permease protein